MRVNLLFGFLGSGKTTLARHLLQERGRDMRTAVIVNEFGDVGIDGKILEGSNVDMVELNSGCMCCTLKGSLMLAIEELREKVGVERVIVEATGVAQPADMVETLTDASMKHKLDIGPLVTVVDAAKYSRLQNALGDFYQGQIENADILVLNKADLASADELEAVRKEVSELNPHASVLFAEQCDVDTGLLLDGDVSSLLARAAAGRPAAARARHRDHHHDHDHDHHHDHDHLHDVDSFVLDASGSSDRVSLKRFFEALPADVWRAKGFMHVDGKPCLVQFSMGQLDITPAQPRSIENMVFIGRHLDKADIEARFSSVRGSRAKASGGSR